MALTNTVVVSNLDPDEFVDPSCDLEFEESFWTIWDDTSEIFDPPPSFLSGLELEMESVKENETNPNLCGLPETPIYNYSSDAETEQDFHDGWYWTYLPNEEDTGPEYGPFLGKQQLLCSQHIKKPEYFLNEMFSPAVAIWVRMTLSAK